MNPETRGYGGEQSLRLAGYLSGNGLLTAVAFGALAGAGAARCAQAKSRG